MYGYIYKTTNLVNGKIYIGQHKHKSFDVNYKGSGKIITQAIEKYGFENFSCKVIEYVNSSKEADEKERYWIAHYRKLLHDNLYNIMAGGNGNFYERVSEEVANNTKEKLSKMNREGICGNKGRHFTEEHKRKIGLANKGKKRTLEQIERNRQSKLGKPAWNKGLTKETDERVRKYIENKKKYHHTEETKRKISESRKGKCIGRKISLETRLLLSKKLKGKKKTNEHLEKIKNVLKNKKWIYKDNICIMIDKNNLEKYLNEGYKLGRNNYKRGNKNENIASSKIPPSNVRSVDRTK